MLHVAREANEDTLKLIQLYRVMSACDLNALWKENKNNSSRWVFFMLSTSHFLRALQFLLLNFPHS